MEEFGSVPKLDSNCCPIGPAKEFDTIARNMDACPE